MQVDDCWLQVQLGHLFNGKRAGYLKVKGKLGWITTTMNCYHRLLCPALGGVLSFPSVFPTSSSLLSTSLSHMCLTCIWWSPLPFFCVLSALPAPGLFLLLNYLCLDYWPDLTLCLLRVAWLFGLPAGMNATQWKIRASPLFVLQSAVTCKSGPDAWSMSGDEQASTNGRFYQYFRTQNSWL